MNIIEKHDLTSMLEQYIEESTEEHASMASYCEEKCIACKKRAIALAIEDYLSIEHDRPDSTLF